MKSASGPPSGDTRSYRVSFDKIHRELPGFECRFTARDGARQLHEIFKRIQMSPDTYQFRAFTRLKQLSTCRRPTRSTRVLLDVAGQRAGWSPAGAASQRGPPALRDLPYPAGRIR